MISRARSCYLLCVALLATSSQDLLKNYWVPWADYVASSNGKNWPNRVEVGVQSFAIPSFLWFKERLVFQVRRIAGNEASSGAGT